MIYFAVGGRNVACCYRRGVQAGFVVCTIIARAVDCRRDRLLRRGIGAAVRSSITQRCLYNWSRQERESLLSFLPRISDIAIEVHS